MSRLYFSASSIESIRLCQHAASLRYNDGVKEPEIEWSQIEAGAEASSKQRATSQGKAVHAIAVDFFAGQPFDEYGEPAKVFQTGMRFLPSPKEWRGLRVEHPIGDPDPEVAAATNGEITHTLEVFGVKWVGFVDASGTVRSMRLRLKDALVVLDHKTSVDPAQYAKIDDELTNDLAAALYAYDALRNMPGDDPSLILYWVYYAKRAKHGAVSVARITRSQCLRVIESAAQVAHAFNLIPDTAHAPHNFDACDAFGGCYYRGGHCTAEPKPGQLIQIRSRKEKAEKARKQERKGRKMALSESLMKRLNKVAEAPAQEADEETEAPDEAEEQEDATEAEEQEEAPPRTEKKASPLAKSKAVQTTIAPAKTASAPLDQLAAKAQKALEARDAARAKLEEADAKLAAIRAQLTAALA